MGNSLEFNLTMEICLHWVLTLGLLSHQTTSLYLPIHESPANFLELYHPNHPFECPHYIAFGRIQHNECTSRYLVSEVVCSGICLQVPFSADYYNVIYQGRNPLGPNGKQSTCVPGRSLTKRIEMICPDQKTYWTSINLTQECNCAMANNGTNLFERAKKVLFN
ncbi:uncharacterized protein LOC134844600 [Symsagittifera roscoffensis]|uniref:uncharacterized protein LOC134844600 n=1 Tax=Symsagittifera roscoffensis TaxID=84072 RepID=UPI00307BEDF6